MNERFNEYYRDFFSGCSAILTRYEDGNAHLVVFNRNGNMTHRKTYKTYRGARIAMGRMGDGWYIV